MTDLTPEQEVLVEAGARAMFDEAAVYHEIGSDLLEATWQHDRKAWQASARAIIPLIFTAGRRAGIEEALRPLRQIAWYEPSTVITSEEHGDRETMINIAREAIRNLSEESGRG